MGFALLKSRAPYRLHIRCEGCLRESSQVLEVPEEVDLPNDQDELVDGGYLNNIPFSCPHCESLIGKLFAISGGRSHD